MGHMEVAPQAELSPILQAVSRELTSLGDMGSLLQTVLSSLAAAHARVSGEPHVPGSEDIQALDLFTQRLFVLADFLTALAPTVTPGSRGDLGLALEGVNLADVARRLGSDRPADDAPLVTGELDLFDLTQAAAPLDQRLYFGSLAVLALESSPLELDLLAQVLNGFRVRTLARFGDAQAAWSYLEHDSADLLFVGSAAGVMDEFEFIRRLRRSKTASTRTSPIVLLSGHTQRSNVLRARDCGASFVVAKPITPKVLYARIVWLAKDRRTFVDGDNYAGPDRRFQNLGPPEGMEGRRSDDLSLQVGSAVEDNMSQDEIDAMLNPKGAMR